VAVHPGMCDQREADYFGAAAAEAADVAASAAALAAVAESAAADAAESAAGGVVSVVGAGASVLLPQALNTSAATKALNASLVFIYRYPGKYVLDKTKRPSVFLGFHPDVAADFRGFYLNFISLSPIMYGL
jgi:hypothetical protein